MKTFLKSIRRASPLATMLAGLAVIAASVAAVADRDVGSWHPTSPMAVARAFHTASLLKDGRVLVAGGYNGACFLLGQPCNPLFMSAELYNPRTGTWSPAAPMHLFRAAHTATVLKDGRVLVAGGESVDFSTSPPGPGTTNTAETYNPRTNTWTLVAPMNEPRADMSANLLSDGRVLVAGGVRGMGGTGSQTAEIYNPVANTWTYTESMHFPRFDHTGTGLTTEIGGSTPQDAQQSGGDRFILAAGGWADGSGPPLNSAEIYDAKRGHWTLTGNLKIARGDHIAALIKPGVVLVAGGAPGPENGGSYMNTAEIFNAEEGTWRLTTPMNFHRNDPSATRLKNGMILVSGGHADVEQPQATSEVFDPQHHRWIVTNNMSDNRAGHTSTRLKDGRVLAAGGLNHSPVATNSADLFVSAGGDSGNGQDGDNSGGQNGDSSGG